MTKRDFFILVIKLFGLGSLVTSLFGIFPAFYSYGSYGLDFKTMVAMLLAILIILGLFVTLVFKAHKVVDLLNLDQGFEDDKIDFKHLNSTHIIQIGLIIIGGLLILNNISAFLSHAYFSLRTDLIGDIYADKLNWAISSCNLVVGYLLLSNHSALAKYLTSKT